MLWWPICNKGRSSSTEAPGAVAVGATCPDPSFTAGDGHIDTGLTAQELPHGSADHGNASLHREQVLAAPPATLPGTSEFHL